MVQHEDSETRLEFKSVLNKPRDPEQVTYASALGSIYKKAMMSTIHDNDTGRDTTSRKCSTLFNPCFAYSQPGTADHHYPLQKNHRFHSYAS